MLKYTIVFVSLFFSIQVNALIEYSIRETFICSTGDLFHVLRRVNSFTQSNTNWGLHGFCNITHLHQKTYHSIDYIIYRAEIQSCMDEDTVQVRKCFEEYNSLNLINGRGNLPRIKHSQIAQKEIPFICNSNQINGALHFYLQRKELEYHGSDRFVRTYNLSVKTQDPYSPPYDSRLHKIQVDGLLQAEISENLIDPGIRPFIYSGSLKVNTTNGTKTVDLECVAKRNDSSNSHQSQTDWGFTSPAGSSLE